MFNQKMLKQTILLLSLIHLTQGLCDRVFFEQPIDQIELAYKDVINGVFVKTSTVVDGFPVFKNERGPEYFQYNKTMNRFYFSFLKQGRVGRIQVSAEANSYLMDGRWTQPVKGKTRDVFKMLALRWYQYDPKSKTHVPLKSTIQARCVKFTECGDNPIIFTEPGREVDEFVPLWNVVVNARTVYKHKDKNLYMYFHANNMWYIGKNYLSDVVSWLVFDQPLQPELIVGTWRRWNGNEWEWRKNATVQCKGRDEPCLPGRCQNDGVCSMNRLNNSVCTCQYGRKGDRCSETENDSCNFIFGEEVVESQRTSVGTVGVSFCPDGSYYPAKCVKQENENKWRHFGQCYFPTKKTSTITDEYAYESTAEKPKTEYSFMKLLVLPIVVILLFFAPLVLIICIRKSRLRFLTIWWYIAMWICILYIVVYFVAGLDDWLLFWLLFIAMGQALFFYAFGIVECMCSNELQYIGHSMDDVDKFFANMFRSKPEVVVIVSCYHFEERTRTEYYTDRNGKRQSRTEVYQEKVVSFVGKGTFDYALCLDVSEKDKVPKVEGKVVRIKFSKEVSFGDTETRLAFEVFRDSCVNSYRNRDQYIEHAVSYNIEGFKERIMSHRPWWMNKALYYLSHVLLLGWPYRWLLTKSSVKANYSIVKEIYFQTPQKYFSTGTPVDYHGPHLGEPNVAYKKDEIIQIEPSLEKDKEFVRKNYETKL